MDLEMFAVLLLFNAAGLLFAALGREKLIKWLAAGVKTELLDWFSEPVNQKAIAENAQNLVIKPAIESFQMALIGRKGGLVKGVNSQMKGLENELIGQGLDIVTGFPGVGSIAVEYLDKYPILKTLLPLVMSRMGQGGVAPSQGLEGSGYTDQYIRQIQGS